jgi:hypothetical protein
MSAEDFCIEAWPLVMSAAGTNTGAFGVGKSAKPVCTELCSFWGGAAGFNSGASTKGNGKYPTGRGVRDSGSNTGAFGAGMSTKGSSIEPCCFGIGDSMSNNGAVGTEPCVFWIGAAGFNIMAICIVISSKGFRVFGSGTGAIGVATEAVGWGRLVIFRKGGWGAVDGAKGLVAGLIGMGTVAAGFGIRALGTVLVAGEVVFWYCPSETPTKTNAIRTMNKNGIVFNGFLLMPHLMSLIVQAGTEKEDILDSSLAVLLPALGFSWNFA